MKFTKEFKEALLDLPIKEKDKLLLRLLKKDIKLFKRLDFQLIDERTVEERRQDILAQINEHYEKSMGNRFYILKNVKKDYQVLSALITEHVFITNDKIGEIHLSIQMLTIGLKSNKDFLLSRLAFDMHKTNMYIVNKIYKILSLINKLHEDMYLDFQEDLRLLLKEVLPNDYLVRAFINNGLDFNWLSNGPIPSDIDLQIKNLRKSGFLK